MVIKKSYLIFTMLLGSLLLSACREKCKPIRKKPALFFIEADTTLNITKATMFLDNKDSFDLIDAGKVYYTYKNNSAAASQILYNELPMSQQQFDIRIQIKQGKQAYVTFRYRVIPIYNTCKDLVDYAIQDPSITNVINPFNKGIRVGISRKNAVISFLTTNIFYQTYEDYTGIELH